MIVLSLFDGMSCGQIALKQIGIIPTMYYSSEINKHAIKQTQLNFPNTVQLGDVEKWKQWDIEWSKIDLLIAGSPCQGFSFAGKQLAFNDERSKLFFVFIDILNHIRSVNPRILFLLENVNMKKSHMRIISEYCGVFPVNINSNLVSAQNRNRWYWTNIRTKQEGLFGELYVDIPQPTDKQIFIKDIIEENVDKKYYLSDKLTNSLFKHSIKNNAPVNILSLDDKSPCFDANCYKMNLHTGYINVSCLTGKRSEYGKQIRKEYEKGKISAKRNEIRFFEERNYGKTNCITSVQKDNILCITSNDIKLRKLTPTECSRLQTIPNWYKWKCSDTQCYIMLGNGWTVDVIAHIFSFINK